MSLIIYKKNVPNSGVNPIKSLRLNIDSDDMPGDSIAFSINLKLEIKSDEDENHSDERNEEVKEHNQYLRNRKYDFYNHKVLNSFNNSAEVETDDGWDPNWDEEIEGSSDDRENGIEKNITSYDLNRNDGCDDEEVIEEMSDKDFGNSFAPFFKNEREVMEIWGKV